MRQNRSARSAPSVSQTYLAYHLSIRNCYNQISIICSNASLELCAASLFLFGRAIESPDASCLSCVDHQTFDNYRFLFCNSFMKLDPFALIGPAALAAVRLCARPWALLLDYVEPARRPAQSACPPNRRLTDQSDRSASAHSRTSVISPPTLTLDCCPYLQFRALLAAGQTKII